MSIKKVIKFSNFRGHMTPFCAIGGVGHLLAMLAHKIHVIGILGRGDSENKKNTSSIRNCASTPFEVLSTIHFKIVHVNIDVL
jgi:hypothetical protein